MERIPAFRQKINESEIETSISERKIEQPLRSLEEDKREIAGFNFALNSIINGTLTDEAQLRAFANPRFRQANGQDYLVDGRDQYVSVGGIAFTRGQVESQQLSVEKVPLLAGILREREIASKEKASTESQIAGFNFALNSIINGTLTDEAQLRAFANPRFRQANGQDYLVDGRDQYVSVGGIAFTRGQVESQQLSVEKVPLLAGILREREIASKEKASTESQIAGFNFALNSIINGTLTDEAQLRAFANPRFRQANGQDYLVDGRDQYVSVGGIAFTRGQVESQQLSKKDLELSIRLLKIVKSTNFPEEVKQNLRQYAQTGNDQVLERLRIVLANAGNEQMSSEISELVDDLINYKRIAGLKRDIYGGIVENKPIAELSKQLTAFEGREIDDLKLVAELQTAIAAKRKQDIVALANKSLQIPARDINKTITEITPLLSSAREDERETGILLLKSAYRAELANFKNEVQKMVTGNVNPEMLRIYIDGLPVRPSVGDIDYVQTVVETRGKAFTSVNEIIKERRLEAALRIRESFANLGVDLVLANIGNFPGETERDRAIKVQLLELYKGYVAANKPEIFDANFAEEIKRREKEQLEARFVEAELGRNKEAFDFVRGRFVETIYPLVESLRADSTTSKKINSFLESDKNNLFAPNPRRQFEQRMALLEKQRSLTDTERTYLQSVEMLSVFNPYLVACAYTDPGVTSEFLRHHFETISQETTSSLKDGDYFPAIQVGLGPDGLAAIGETVRNNPDLASEMLIVDAGKQPGGPFAIPEGAAWELNSANRRGAGGRTLPKKPGADELKTVRAYGSPLRWYPGERGAEKNIRQGSINTTVDYLPTPDELSNARYPTNEELQSILAMQTALLTKNVALQTRFVDLEQNSDPHIQGDKIVTLEITHPRGGTRRVKLGTDAFFPATGLGESGYGFKLQGSRAEKVISETKSSSAFPKISRTLEAFNALAGRTKDQVSPGETIVIWGKGNSADTLIENIGNIFQGENPRVRDITKVYVIAEGDLSARPRYALINDLKPRNGRGNLIEQINARVTDVDFADQTGEPTKRKLLFYGADDQVIRDRAGAPITADSGIAATGFRSNLNSLLKKYALQKSGGVDGGALREPLTLPTNPDVSVAETLKADPSVLILGTASSADFENIDKLAQLPAEAREALLRNGAENAVAIGFRAPDVQAAMNIWLNSRDIQVEKKSATSDRKLLTIDSSDSVKGGSTFWLERVISPDDIRIPNNIGDEVRLLSPLFAYNVGNSIEINNANGKKFSGELNFSVTYNQENQMLGLTLSEQGNPVSVSKEVIEAIKKACMDSDFQKYALVALKKKKKKSKA